MTKGQEIARAACRYLGTPYSVMDCQKFIEKTLADCEILKDLAGSNAWIRFVMENGFVGTPEEVTAKFGGIPAGAFLFILQNDGKEPEKYHGDGIGNASHIGVYTALTGNNMAAIAAEFGVKKPYAYIFGDGAIHSSSSRGCVATSKFSGHTIKGGGWNRVGLWKAINYGEPFDSILRGVEPPDDGGKMTTATVYAESGSTVNLRAKASVKSDLIDRVPIGETVDVLQTGDDWSRCEWHKKTGYIMSKFLIIGDVTPGEDGGSDPTPEGMILVNAADLEKIYDMVGNLLGVRG